MDYVTDSCRGGRNEVFWNVRGMTSPGGGAGTCPMKHFGYGFPTSESCVYISPPEKTGILGTFVYAGTNNVKGQADSDVICIKQIRLKVFALRDVKLYTNELENITDKFRADLIIRSLFKIKISGGAGDDTFPKWRQSVDVVSLATGLEVNFRDKKHDNSETLQDTGIKLQTR